MYARLNGILRQVRTVRRTGVASDCLCGLSAVHLIFDRYLFFYDEREVKLYTFTLRTKDGGE